MEGLVAGALADLGVQRRAAQPRCLAHGAARKRAGGGEGRPARRPVAAELWDQAEVDRVLDEALALSGGLDILFNNAAVDDSLPAPYTTSTPKIFA